jgi:predicted 3-demethylubiquinone-9 3-methyltransferase (glyoxalase superfamily)
MKHEKITPFLWFDHGKALPAAKFYVSIFPRSKITDVMMTMQKIDIAKLERESMPRGARGARRSS